MVTTNTDCYYAINAFDSVDNQLNPTNCTLSGTNASNGSGTVNALAVLAPFTEVEADASETGSSVGFGVPNFLAYSSLSYSLKVNGGNLGDRVPLIMTTSASLTGSPSAGSATAYLLVGDGPGLSITDCFGVFNCGTPGITVCNPAGGPGMKCASLAELPKDFNLTVAAGSPIDVLMQATATADTFFGSPASAKAIVDPFFEIDPSFANASLYSIELSPGVGNSIAQAPEPGTLALVAFAMFALFLRWGVRRPPLRERDN